ncbi:hypothetical protein, partial [Escherichia coli]|uniref:hypothetical protein n=1 Tax=Escherichia coli TaxID=562 RepID=UPI00215AC2E8
IFFNKNGSWEVDNSLVINLPLLNVSYNDTEVITLSQAISRVPADLRKRGLLVTFRSSSPNSFETYQYKGGNPNDGIQWENVSNWERSVK